MYVQDRLSLEWIVTVRQATPEQRKRRNSFFHVQVFLFPLNNCMKKGKKEEENEEV